MLNIFSNNNDKVVFESTPTVEALLSATYVIDRFFTLGVEKTCLFIITDGIYDPVYLEKNREEKRFVPYSDKTSLVIDNLMLDLFEQFPNIKFKHRNWIIETIFLNIKKKYGSFISLSYVGNFNNMYKEFFQNSSHNNEEKMMMNQFSYYEEYMYLWKHLCYFDNYKDIHNKPVNKVLTYNFKSNPFLDQYQFFDTEKSKNTEHENIFTRKSFYYKQLKIFATEFVKQLS